MPLPGIRSCEAEADGTRPILRIPRERASPGRETDNFLEARAQLSSRGTTPSHDGDRTARRQGMHLAPFSPEHCDLVARWAPSPIELSHWANRAHQQRCRMSRGS